MILFLVTAGLDPAIQAEVDGAALRRAIAGIVSRRTLSAYYDWAPGNRLGCYR